MTLIDRTSIFSPTPLNFLSPRQKALYSWFFAEQMAGRTISQDEINIYDRQIRLWGIDAQTRISNSRVLLVKIRELAEEIGKNLVLAGIGSLTLLDGEKIDSIGSNAHFCIHSSDIGKTVALADSKSGADSL